MRNKRYGKVGAWTCEKCNGDSTVIDGDKSIYGPYRRRRKCLNCGFRWSTVELRVSDQQKVKSEHVSQ